MKIHENINCMNGQLTNSLENGGHFYCYECNLDEEFLTF